MFVRYKAKTHDYYIDQYLVVHPRNRTWLTRVINGHGPYKTPSYNQAYTLW